MNPQNWHGSCHAGRVRPVAIRVRCVPCPAGLSIACRFPACIKLARRRIPAARSRVGPGGMRPTVMLKDFGTSIEEVIQKKA